MSFLREAGAFKNEGHNTWTKHGSSGYLVLSLFCSTVVSAILYIAIFGNSCISLKSGGFFCDSQS
jgi:hypothetical protein